MKPTIVLVHGAFADASSWNGVIEPLAGSGHRVIAAANPLRGLASDAAAVSDLIASVDGRVVLVGHSYGGAVITNVTDDAGKITSLVYVSRPAAGGGVTGDARHGHGHRRGQPPARRVLTPRERRQRVAV